MSGFQIQEREAVKAGIVSPNVYGEKRQLSPQARLSEAEGLARSIKLDIAFSESVNIKDIRAGSYFGEGYIDKLRTQIEEQGIELLIVDSSLSPLQQRNLEKKLNTKVIDRRALILEIFGERAQTKEGKLQVELAHLSYQRSRLVRSWTHLERQRGGAGFLGGPGETQIELDRRIIDDKIIRIRECELPFLYSKKLVSSERKEQNWKSLDPMIQLGKRHNEKSERQIGIFRKRKVVLFFDHLLITFRTGHDISVTTFTQSQFVQDPFWYSFCIPANGAFHPNNFFGTLCHYVFPPADCRYFYIPYTNRIYIL